MKLETDPRVVMKLGEEREEENWRFRSFLKQLDIDVEELDAIVHRHYEAVSGRIDCTYCANCCREERPVLSGDDVDTLASGLMISNDELRERFLAVDEEGDLVFNTRPCPLLEGNLCSAYDHRPEACRSYPHLHKDEFVFRLINVVHNCSVCPIVFNVLERLKEEYSNEFSKVMDDEDVF